MPDLSAAELHALVNSRYVMPDGSERRALWERVPETRPTSRRDFGIKPDLALVPPQELSRSWAFQRPDGTAVYVFPTEVAVSVVRVAIEDWLTDEHPDFRIAMAGLDGADTVFVILNSLCGELQPFDEHGNPVLLDVISGKGSTVLHALVAVSHAAADTLGVPH